MMHRMFAAAALAVASLGGVASADTFDFNTDQNYLTSSGGWTTDRMNPAQFEASGGKLITSVSSTDYQGEGAQVFYNTQGMQHTLTPIIGSQTLSFDMLVDTTGWAGKTLRSGVWGVGYDASNNLSTYPIVSYIQDPNMSVGPNTGQSIWTGPGFYAWNETTSGWDWLSSGISNAWNHVTIKLTEGVGYTYFINGVQSPTFLPLTTPDAATRSLNAVIVNSRNYGDSYTAKFDNITTAAVPLPASAWAGTTLMGLLLAHRTLNRRAQSA